MKVNIYALIDPNTLKVRYIGRTKCTLDKRLAEHVSKSKLDYNNTHKSNWIKKLLKCNSRPFIRLLCVVYGWDKSHEIERGLINKYKDRLLNHEDRGEGGLNHQISDEQKSKISNTLKARYTTGNIKNAAWKTVYVYNLNGEFIQEFKSARLASDSLHIAYSSIYKCTSGISKQYCGFQFNLNKVDKMNKIDRKPKVNKNNG